MGYVNTQHRPTGMLVLISLRFFFSPYMWLKKRGNFKTNTLVDSIESFLYCLSSSSIHVNQKINGLKSPVQEPIWKNWFKNEIFQIGPMCNVRKRKERKKSCLQAQVSALLTRYSLFWQLLRKDWMTFLNRTKLS